MCRESENELFEKTVCVLVEKDDQKVLLTNHQISERRYDDIRLYQHNLHRHVTTNRYILLGVLYHRLLRHFKVWITITYQEVRINKINPHSLKITKFMQMTITTIS